MVWMKCASLSLFGIHLRFSGPHEYRQYAEMPFRNELLRTLTLTLIESLIKVGIWTMSCCISR